MACNRPIYYPFLSDSAQQRIDALLADCIQGRISEAEFKAQERSERVRLRQEGRSERVESRMEAAEEIGYYATDALFSEAIPAAAGAISSAIGLGVGGFPFPTAPSAPQTPQAPQAPKPPYEQSAPLPTWVWGVGLAALAVGVFYAR